MTKLRADPLHKEPAEHQLLIKTRQCDAILSPDRLRPEQDDEGQQPWRREAPH